MVIMRYLKQGAFSSSYNSLVASREFLKIVLNQNKFIGRYNFNNI